MHFEILGRTDSGAEVIVLSSGLGGAGGFWAPQLPALLPHFKIVLYDHRGTGKSGGVLPEGYGIGHMADDVLEVLDRAGIGRAHLMGHALGGLVGLELALRAPARVGRLVLVNAWAAPNAHSKRCFDVRRDLLRDTGVEAYVRAQPIFLYPGAWMLAHAERVAAEEAHGIAHFQGAETILKRIAALLAFDVAGRLKEIATPALVLATRDDVLVPHTCSEALAAGLPNSMLKLFDFGGHGVTVTETERFNAAMLDFLLQPAARS